MSTYLVLRDRLLTELVEPSSSGAPSASLIAASDDEAELILSGGERCWLLTANDDAESIGRRAGAIIAEHRGQSIVLVAVGGDSRTAAALKAVIPFFQLSGRIGAFQLDGDSRLRKLSGRKSPALVFAARGLRDRLASLQGERVLGREQLEQWIRAARGEAENEMRFAASLSRRFPIVTVSIAVACGALYALSVLWGGGHFQAALWHLGANDHERVLHGEWWRLLSAAFLHGNFMHLAVNMLALFSFGVFLERLMGPYRFLVLYTLSGLVGSIASGLVPRAGIAVGASGAIWGLMAAGAALAWKPRGLLPPLTLDAFKRQAVAPVVINVFYSFKQGIDFMAHFGGGAAGFALMASGVMTRGLRSAFAAETDRESIVPASAGGWRAAAALCAVACLASIGTSMEKHRPWELSHPAFSTRTLGDSGLTVDLPSYMEAQPIERSSPQDWTIYGYGIIPRDPIALEIHVRDRVSENVGAAIEPVIFDELQSQLRTAPIEGASLVGAPQALEIGGRKFVAADYRIGRGATIRTFATVIDRRVISLTCYAIEASDSWDDATRGIAGSLRPSR